MARLSRVTPKVWQLLGRWHQELGSSPRVMGRGQVHINTKWDQQKQAGC